MATMTERLAFLITLNADQAVSGFQKLGKTAEGELKKTESRLDKTATSMQKWGAGAVAFAGLAGKALWSLGQDASNMEQAVGGSMSVFGDAQDIVAEFADGSAQSFGISKTAALELTSQLGALLKGFGFTREEAATMSVKISQLGADLAAAFGGKPEEAVEALGAALRGEFNPVEKFGVSLTAASIAAHAVEMGLAASTAEVDANAKATAALDLIYQQTADVQGQFGREAQTAAGQQAILAATIEDLKAEIGAGLLPIMQSALGFINGLVTGFKDLPGPVKSTIGTVAGFSTILLGVGGAVSFAVGSVIKMRDNIRDLGKSFRNMGTFGKIATVSMGALAAASLYMGLKAKQAAENSQKFSNSVSELGRASEDAIGGLLEAIVYLGKIRDDSPEETFRKVAKESLASAISLRDNALASDEVRASVERAGLTIETLNKIIDEETAAQARASEASEKAAEAVDKAGEATQEAVAPTEELTAILDALTAAEEGRISTEEALAAITGVAADATAEAVTPAEQLADISEKIKEVQEGRIPVEELLADIVALSADATADATDELGRNKAATDAARLAAEQRTAAIDAEREAEEKRRQAILDSTFGLYDHESATLALEDAYVEYNESLGETLIAIDQGTLKGAELEAAQRSLRQEEIRLAEQALQTASSYATQQGATEGTELHTRYMKEELLRLAEKYPHLRDEIGQYVAKLDTIPANKQTTIQALGIPEAVESVNTLIRRIDAVTGKTVTIRVRTEGGETSYNYGPPGSRANSARAVGGPVEAGRTYWVGEHGPEPFVPSQDGRILSTSEARMAMRPPLPPPAPARGVEQQPRMGDVHIHGNVYSTEDLNRTFRDAWREMERQAAAGYRFGEAA